MKTANEVRALDEMSRQANRQLLAAEKFARAAGDLMYQEVPKEFQEDVSTVVAQLNDIFNRLHKAAMESRHAYYEALKVVRDGEG